jgi:ketosteroid isomerase-like protein
VNGDAGPLNAITAEDAVFFDPNGDRLVGVEEVTTRYAANAGLFVRGTYEFELLECHSSSEIAYLSGVQTTRAQLRGSDSDIVLTLRVTEVYKRSADGWVVAHRHADRISNAPEEA